MLDAGLLLSFEDVLGGGHEEDHDVVVREGRRVGHVDHDVGAGQGVVQSFAGQDVDAGPRRGRYRVVTVGIELLNDLRADQPGSADDDDPSRVAPLWDSVRAEADASLCRIDQ